LTENAAKPVLSAQGIFWYTLANLGFGAFYAFNNFALPVWLKHFTANAILLGLMAGTHSFEGVVLQPVVGAWSDRLRSPLGRRRPFLLVAVPISALFLLLAPLAAHLPHGVRLALIVACIVAFTMTFNVAIDPYQSLLADITTTQQRGRVTGLWYFVGLLGQIVILLLIFLLRLPVAAGFALVAGLMLLTTLLTCLRTREPQNVPPPAPAASYWSELAQAVRGLRTLRQMRVYLLTFFLYGIGIDAVVPNLSLFIKGVTGCSDAIAAMMPIALLVCAALGSAPFGWVSDRIGPKRLLMVSLGMIALAALGGLWVHSLLQVGLVLALAGLGTAAQNASAFPLLTRLVPGEEVGFYTGLQTAALALAGPLSLWGTGALINHRHHDYRVIFLVCFLGIAAALLTLRFLRLGLAPQEIAARRREQGRAIIEEVS